MREDWLKVELQEVFETVTGNTPSKKEIDNYGQDIPFIKPPDITNSAINSISEYLSNKGKQKARVLPSNSVLITCIGNLGRVGFNKDEVAFNQQINAILPTDFIDFKFTFYQAQSGNFRNQLESLSTSTTVALVNKSSFNSVEIEIAPLPIQRAIVSKIEALFSDLDNGIANFKKAQEQLKIYRQAVLKKAFEGGFLITNKELRITNEENHSSDNLPNGWKWVKLGEVISISSGKGLTKENREDSGDFYVYGGNGITGKHSEYLFEKEKLIIGRVGVHCGNIHITKPKSWITDNAFVVSFNENDIDLQFLCYLLKVLNLNNYASSTAQPVISQSKIYPIEFSFPTNKSEQIQIVQEIESRLSVCDKMEQSISESIQKAEALRQSILKKAFEGRLLSEAEVTACKQAADYEPASELLKKIKAEKVKARLIASQPKKKSKK